MDVSRFAASTTEVDGFFQQFPKGKKPAAKKTALPAPKEGEHFVRGPIPLRWLKVAATCGDHGVAVGVLLFYAAAWQKSNPVKLSNSILSELDVNSRTAKRCLEKMEAAGLVSVEFRRGRAPLVTIQEN